MMNVGRGWAVGQADGVNNSFPVYNSANVKLLLWYLVRL